MLSAPVAALRRYTRWLHTGWPAGGVEPLPEIDPDGRSSLRGVYVVGDLTGIPLLKLSAESGARAVRAIAADPAFRAQRAAKAPGVREVAIVGAGVSGLAAALEARRLGLDFVVFEAQRRLQTIADFPERKPIFTYPSDYEPASELRMQATIKEDLLAELEAQTADVPVADGRVVALEREGRTLAVALEPQARVRALRVVVAIGRSGEFRRLDVPGEDLAKVHNRLHDPSDFRGRRALVVGGGDSAVEAAIALARSGAEVTLSYRGGALARPKPENVAALLDLARDPAPKLVLALGTRVKEILPDAVVLERAQGAEQRIPNDVVFSMVGRHAPVEFFRRAGIRLRGETRGLEWAGVVGFFLAVFLLYAWKTDGFLLRLLGLPDGATAFPGSVPSAIASLGAWWTAQVSDRSTLLGTVAVSMQSRSFYYTLLYTAAIGGFGLVRILRRRTRYVTLQTVALFAIQLVPLFLLPEVLLPWLGYNGWFDGGAGGAAADALFEKYIPADAYLAQQWPEWGHPRAYWRAYGLILAWPLMVYNVFTEQPLGAWLAISFLQTFVLIPWLVWRWGKGAYCGWICSCGGLAETAGDTLRQRMPHGPGPNRLNMAGQALLALALALLALRVVGWVFPDGWADRIFPWLLDGRRADGTTVNPVSWKWTVDVILAGILGVGLYLRYSGRVWCRFFCPLAALMHVYARFTRFRIFADKPKCISCNVCTAVCHQGIDVMSFANKGLPMTDPQCVRCSACVQSCPTGVLWFGHIGPDGDPIADAWLPASPVRARER